MFSHGEVSRSRVGSRRPSGTTGLCLANTPRRTSRRASSGGLLRFNHSLGRAAEITLALVTAVLASVSVISAAPVAAATPGTWSPIGGPGPGYGASNAIVWDVAFYNGDLYVAGDFDTTFQGQNAFNLARWNGTAWSGVGTNFDETEVVRELEVLGDYLYIGGAFTDAANIPEADNIARWNGTTWSAVGPTGPGESAIDAGPAVGVESMAVRGTDLLIGGSFENVDNKEAADNIARWSGSDWFAIGANDSGNGAIQGGVKDILVRPDGFYAAGAFRDVNGIDAADYVAFWDGDDWLPLPESQIAINNTVNALVMTGNDLYLGGNFLNLEGSERPDLSNYVARWDGTDWHGVGIFNDEREDLNGPVFDLAIYNGQIIAGGNFNSQADAIGVYDGTSWSTLGPDGALHGMVFNLVVNGSDLYVSGRFSNAGGIDNADHLAIFRAPINRPDGRIRKGTGAYIGNNVYNTDG